MSAALLRLCVVVTVIGAFATQSYAQDRRYIVKMREGRAAAGHAALRAAGAQLVLRLDRQNAVAARIPAAALPGLSRNPNVEYIEEDAVREPYSASNTAVAGGTEIVPYGIHMVQAQRVVPDDAGAVRLCIIDSGYSDGHADLRDGTGQDLTALTRDAGSGTWNTDSCGHGTHVAGTAAATSGNHIGVVGANPGAALHIVKVFGNDTLVENGSCGWTYSSTLVSALESCRQARATVVSMSLGGGAKSRTEESAFADANRAGILSIAAAGNSGNGATSYPAGYASVVSVAAVDANGRKAEFSQTNRDVEIAAPGVSVLSAVPWRDLNTLSAGSTTWSGGRLEGALRTDATGAIVDGGLCTSAGAWAGKVVLCQRGSISFADKVGNVQAGGGAAAVVYNNAASDPTCGAFGGTLGDRVTTTIPAITLSCADGAEASARAGAPGTVASSFTVPESGYESWDGTSMATPHVSAVAALVWSCAPGATNKQVRDALNAGALDLGTPGRDSAYGFGLVQAAAALEALTRTVGPTNCRILQP